MLPILDSRVFFDAGKWAAACEGCGKTSMFSNKNSALSMVNRGSCRNCKRDYRNVTGDVGIYKNSEGKWCSVCSCCGKEQAYTRKDHAKQSHLSDWQCRPCAAKAKGFSSNLPVGNEKRLYNKFRKSANSRGIDWNLDFEQFCKAFTGKCALTGWDIDMSYGGKASFDRIDSDKPYEPGNVQWVHSMVNMCKNKYSNDSFVDMCLAVADKAKWQGSFYDLH